MLGCKASIAIAAMLATPLAYGQSIACSTDSLAIGVLTGHARTEAFELMNNGAALMIYQIVISDHLPVGSSEVAEANLTLARLDSIQQITGPVDLPSGVAWDGEYLWVSGQGSPYIFKLDTAGAVVDTIAAPGENHKGLAWDGSYLWHATDYQDKIFKIDPLEGTTVDSFISPCGGICPSGLAFDGEHLWVSSYLATTICQLDTINGNILKTIPAPSNLARGITWDGMTLWFADHGDKALYQINPVDGMVIRSAAYDQSNPDIAFDGAGLWVSDYTDGTLTNLALDHSWLAIAPTTGELPTDSSVNVEVAINSESLQPGTYFNYMTIISNDNSQSTVPIHLEVVVADENIPPQPFQLVFPQNSAMVTDLLPAFGWEAAIDPDRHPSGGGGTAAPVDQYLFQIGSSANLLEAESMTTSEPHLVSETLLLDHQIYYWTVITSDIFGEVTVSDTFWFSTNMANDPPEPFELIEPVDGATIKTSTPQFIWESTVDPDLFEDVYYCLEIGLIGADLVEIYSGPDTAFTVVDSLIENTQYFWRVTAKDTVGAVTPNDGGIRSFIVNVQNSPPGPFELLSPVDGGTVRTITPRFSWQSTSDPDLFEDVSYCLEIGLIGADLVEIYSGPDTAFTVVDSLIENTQYFWRVTAKDTMGAVTPNDDGIRSFIVNVENSPPGPFELLSPADGAMIDNLTAELKWSHSNDIDGSPIYIPNVTRVNPLLVPSALPELSVVRYNVYLDRDSTFTGTIARQSQTNSYLVELTEDIIYYWQIGAVDSSGSETLSETRWFWTNTVEQSPAGFELLAPIDASTIDTTTLLFEWRSAIDPDLFATVTYSLYTGLAADSLIIAYTGTDTSVTVLDGFAENSSYYWQVLASDGITTPTTSSGEPRLFTVNLGNEAPTSAQLLAPVDSAILDNPVVNFIWEPASDPDPGDSVNYEFSCFIRGTQWKLIDQQFVDSTALQLDGLFLENGAYQWTVSSYDLIGAVTPGDTASFWLDELAEPPGVFLALNPPDEATGLAMDVQFAWETARDPDPFDRISYRLTYATDWSDSLTHINSLSLSDTTYSITLNPNTAYWWIVVASDQDGYEVAADAGQPLRFTVGSLELVTQYGLPTSYAIHQNYPNPFNPSTTIRFDTPEANHVELLVYDILGRQVASLARAFYSAGQYHLIWRGMNDDGQLVPSGIYFAVMRAGDYRRTIKLVLMR
ncbi:T9SS type A sorting domain-containing protein [Candidatus Neomarinimicrobiota bacterium]